MAGPWTSTSTTTTPEGAPVGIPAWLGWQHFFNVFLMVLIIRSGLTIRHEKRPAVFWAPKNNPKGKTSLTIWFHQGLDIFWIVNGLVFVVLLFVTGQWMRIVPTSWEVFPNALSAALQYVSLDWPTENGWVNYNALQQIARGSHTKTRHHLGIRPPVGAIFDLGTFARLTQPGNAAHHAGIPSDRNGTDFAHRQQVNIAHRGIADIQERHRHHALLLHPQRIAVAPEHVAFL
mgnify:CR=1 FL=1